jgi:uncharacterized protein (DUF1330 family)
MAAYLVVEVTDMTNPEGMSEYVANVPALVTQYGGRYLANGPATVLEGDHHPQLLVLLEFESMDQLRALYECEAYAPYKELRQRAASMNFLAVEGM